MCAVRQDIEIQDRFMAKDGGTGMFLGSGPKSEVSCACGLVQLQTTDDPLLSVFCHCSLCRRTSNAPVFWGAAYAPDSVQGVDENLMISTLLVPEKLTTRHSCKSCGTFVLEKVGTMPMVVLPCAIMSKAPKPQCHIFTTDAIMKIPDDGLPRYQGMPPM